MHFKLGVLKNFTTFTLKHMRWSLKTYSFIKKRLQHRYFSVNTEKSLRSAFFIEYFQWLWLPQLIYYVLKGMLELCSSSGISGREIGSDYVGCDCTALIKSLAKFSFLLSTYFFDFIAHSL